MLWPHLPRPRAVHRPSITTMRLADTPPSTTRSGPGDPAGGRRGEEQAGVGDVVGRARAGRAGRPASTARHAVRPVLRPARGGRSGPGATALTRMPCAPSSTAAARVWATTAAFGGAVVAVTRRRRQRLDRRHVDDRRAGTHDAGAGPRGPERRRQVAVDDVGELVIRHRRQVGHRLHAGVVDPDVEAAEALDGGGRNLVGDTSLRGGHLERRASGRRARRPAPPPRPAGADDG